MPSQIQTLLREIKQLCTERPTPKHKLMGQLHLLIGELSQDTVVITDEALLELDAEMRQAALLSLAVNMGQTLAEG
ncbi:MAG: hypothetical protein IPK22_11360 [Verrucomicrobiaceae bacterium]|nr:hypothetical protein [Verrucomicrobiaceae bacterium]